MYCPELTAKAERSYKLELPPSPGSGELRSVDRLMGVEAEQHIPILDVDCGYPYPFPEATSSTIRYNRSNDVAVYRMSDIAHGYSHRGQIKVSLLL